MKLLVSPVDETEALEAVAGGADIVDVKNPAEGALGAGFPWVIRRIRDIVPRRLEVSCTLGDLANLPGSAALAALGAASTGVDYVKASLYGVKTHADAVYYTQSIVRAVGMDGSKVKVVVAGFADAKRIDSVDPTLIPSIAHEAGAQVAMLDTAIKDGKNLFSFLGTDALRNFVRATHDFGLQAALAGSLRKEDLPMLYGLGVDIIGVRSAACIGGDRLTGRIAKAKVSELAQIVRLAAR